MLLEYRCGDTVLAVRASTCPSPEGTKVTLRWHTQQRTYTVVGPQHRHVSLVDDASLAGPAPERVTVWLEEIP